MGKIDFTKYKVAVDIQIRFRDTDTMGHVNNAVYLSYLEMARMEYWKRLTGKEDYSPGSFDIILARVEIDYRSPVILGERVRVYVRVSEVRRSSFSFEYSLVEIGSGRTVAQARTVQVFFDYASGKIKRPNPEALEKIKEIDGI